MNVQPVRQSALLQTVLVLLLLVYGGYLRFYGNDGKLFWYDEIYSALWYSGHDLKKAVPDLAGRELEPRELQALLRIDQGSSVPAIIDGIIHDDPQHTPLYFVALRFWAGLAGDSVGALRGFSAVADLLVLPVLFWLCMQLFASARVAWIAVVLVAISPFHMVYSQEARQYTFWMLTIVSSCAVLLWTLRAPAIWKWSLYALTLAAGLYTQLLFCFVVLSHAAYVAGLMFLHETDEPGEHRRIFFGFALAAIGAILLFSPWIWIVITHFATAAAHVSWSEQKVSLLHLIGMWGYNYSAVFLDTNHALKFIDRPGMLVYGTFFLRAVVLVPAGLAVLHLLRHPRRKSSLFLLPMIFLPFLGVALPDLILGGIRSGGGNRYLAASFLGLEVALAGWIATGLDRQRSVHRNMMAATLFAVLAMGVASGLIFRHADTWWIKTVGHFNLEAAKIINREQFPLLVCGSATQLISFSHVLRAEARLMLLEGNESIEIPQNYSAVFVLAPSPRVKHEITKATGLKLAEAFPRAGLYRLEAP